MLRTFENIILGCFLLSPSLHAGLLDPHRVKGQSKHHHERMHFLLNFYLVPTSKHKKKVAVRLSAQGATFCLLCNFN